MMGIFGKMRQRWHNYEQQKVYRDYLLMFDKNRGLAIIFKKYFRNFREFLTIYLQGHISPLSAQIELNRCQHFVDISLTKLFAFIGSVNATAEELNDVAHSVGDMNFPTKFRFNEKYMLSLKPHAGALTGIFKSIRRALGDNDREELEKHLPLYDAQVAAILEKSKEYLKQSRK